MTIREEFGEAVSGAGVRDFTRPAMSNLSKSSNRDEEYEADSLQ